MCQSAGTAVVVVYVRIQVQVVLQRLITAACVFMRYNELFYVLLCCPAVW